MIRKLFYIFAVLVIVVAVIYFIASVAFKPFLLQQLSQTLDRKIEAKNVSISFPLNLEFKDLRIFNKDRKDELLTAESLKIGLNPFSFFSQRVLLNHFILINPRLKLEKNLDNSLNISDLFNPNQKQPPQAQGGKSLLVLHIELKKAQIEFLDKTVSPAAFTTKVDNLNLKIAKVFFPPASATTNFNISFDLVNLADQVKAQAKSRGWVNIVKKDMSANLEIKNFALTYFKPYYKSGFSSIENGILNFTSDVDSKNNELTAICKLEANYLSLARENQGASSLFGVSVSDLVEYLKDSNGKIIMNFTLRGKMDKPQELISQAGSVVINNTLQKLINTQLQRLLDFGEKTSGETGKTQEKLKDIKKVLEGIFKGE